MSRLPSQRMTAHLKLQEGSEWRLMLSGNPCSGSLGSISRTDLNSLSLESATTIGLRTALWRKYSSLWKALDYPRLALRTLGARQPWSSWCSQLSPWRNSLSASLHRDLAKTWDLPRTTTLTCLQRITAL